MISTATIRWDQGDDGIVVLTLDDPAASVNTINQAFIDSLATVLEGLDAERDHVAGVVITSAKRTFCAGANLNEFIAGSRDQFAELIRTFRGQLRRLETLGRPVVAAVNGSALGGGLEICLACHHRVVVADPRMVLGFPEVQLGLLPGAGGVVRSVRLLGVVDALEQLLLEGRRIDPEQANELEIIDELIPSVDGLLPAARAWIAGHPRSVQRWDAQGYRIPGGVISDRELAVRLRSLPAGVRRQLDSPYYPAPRGIVAAAVEGSRRSLEDALAIEDRYFSELARSQVARNMVKALFFDIARVMGARGRPPTAEPFKPSKVVVLGAGMMGAAIAYVCASAGIEVVLKDVDQEAADRGKGYSKKLVDGAMAEGRSTQEQADTLLGRITATDKAQDADGADLVIEAVFEDPKVKAQVFAEIELHLAPGAVLASNTSTLPITELAEGVSRPDDFIGLHFFSPVDKMPLLEIIRGEKTSDDTTCRALDFAKQIKKTPIIVNDSRGFFTSRVIGTFLHEGIAMLLDGIPATSIERACSHVGYPAPVLQLCDELNLKLMRKIRVESQAAAGTTSTGWGAHPAGAVIDRMLDEFDRPGRCEGRGFYNYLDGKRVGLWEGLDHAFPPSLPGQIDPGDVEERMLFIEALESTKCLAEQVIESVADANVGSILGIGFPAWTGGVLQYINGYRHAVHGDGPEAFVARARELAGRYGQRFEPPVPLVERAARGEFFSDEQLSALAV